MFKLYIKLIYVWKLQMYKILTGTTKFEEENGAPRIRYECDVKRIRAISSSKQEANGSVISKTDNSFGPQNFEPKKKKKNLLLFSCFFPSKFGMTCCYLFIFIFFFYFHVNWKWLMSNHNKIWLYYTVMVNLRGIILDDFILTIKMRIDILSFPLVNSIFSFSSRPTTKFTINFHMHSIFTEFTKF